MSCAPFLSEDGGEAKRVAISRDIAERYQAESDRRAGTQALRFQNEDLERQVAERTAELRLARHHRVERRADLRLRHVLSPDRVQSGAQRRVRLFDADEEDMGPFITVTTSDGELPRMTREDAKTVAGFLLGEDVAPDAARHVGANAGKRWSVEARGTSLVLTGTPAGKGAQSVAFVMAPVVARDLAGQSAA